MPWTKDWTIDSVANNYKAIGMVDPEDVEQLIADSRELDALREGAELDAKGIQFEQSRVHTLEQRLADAEQRNAECVALLRRSTSAKGQDHKTWWNDRALILQAALKPTESGELNQ